MKFTAIIVLLNSLVATTMAACGTAGFKASGSDTVEPIALSWVAPYQKQCPKATPITVTAGGSSVGAKDVCAGTVDIGMMSREFKDTEAKPDGTTGSFTCVSGGKKVTQIAVAADGIIIIAKKNGNAAKCIAALVRNLFSAPRAVPLVPSEMLLEEFLSPVLTQSACSFNSLCLCAYRVADSPWSSSMQSFPTRTRP
jgi:ABC-type phosphate transport system substrate-binding protein